MIDFMGVKMTKSEIMAQLQSIKSELVERYAITQIGIFGSVARNEDRQNSDLDIVVQMSPDLLKRVRLKAELEKLFGRKVDVIRYRDSMNPYLKARIDRDVIYV
jgi:predicted nucleotidyltransferase